MQKLCTIYYTITIKLFILNLHIIFYNNTLSEFKKQWTLVNTFPEQWRRKFHFFSLDETHNEGATFDICTKLLTALKPLNSHLEAQ